MSDAGSIKVLAHLRQSAQSSYNMAALRAAIAQKPAGMTVEVADISQIPLYNEDVRQQGFPPPVETLRRQIEEADALLFVCPEYNYSMSGVLKNAIDWASRPPDQPFAGKPCAIMGAAAGMAGSARAQYDLRRSMRVSRHAPDQQARGADRPGADQVRRRRQSHRRGRARLHPRHDGRARRLDAADRRQEIRGGSDGSRFHRQGRADHRRRQRHRPRHGARLCQERRQGRRRRPRRGGRRGDRRHHPPAGRRGALRRRRRHQIGRSAGLCQGGARRLRQDRLLLQQCRHRGHVDAHRRI